MFLKWAEKEEGEKWKKYCRKRNKRKKLSIWMKMVSNWYSDVSMMKHLVNVIWHEDDDTINNLKWKTYFRPLCLYPFFFCRLTLILDSVSFSQYSSNTLNSFRFWNSKHFIFCFCFGGNDFRLMEYTFNKEAKEKESSNRNNVHSRTISFLSSYLKLERKEKNQKRKGEAIRSNYITFHCC